MRLPDNTQRLSVIGRTGSGKTVFGSYVLSVSPFHVQPYIIVDYKGDKLFREVDRIKEIGLKERLPKYPGVYIIHPAPTIDDDDVTDFLYRVWDHENIGLFFDEAYMVPSRGAALEGILTQGRSLHIPVIALTQRPAWISRFVFSEADFFSIFHLNVADDRARVRSIVGGDLDTKLPEHWSRYYDVNADQLSLVLPSPPPEVIQQRLTDRLTPASKARK